jgi:hypothetical protein
MDPLSYALLMSATGCIVTPLRRIGLSILVWILLRSRTLHHAASRLWRVKAGSEMELAFTLSIFQFVIIVFP